MAKPRRGYLFSLDARVLAEVSRAQREGEPSFYGLQLANRPPPPEDPGVPVAPPAHGAGARRPVVGGPGLATAEGRPRRRLYALNQHGPRCAPSRVRRCTACYRSVVAPATRTASGVAARRGCATASSSDAKYAVGADAVGEPRRVEHVRTVVHTDTRIAKTYRPTTGGNPPISFARSSTAVRRWPRRSVRRRSRWRGRQPPVRANPPNIAEGCPAVSCASRRSSPSGSTP